MTFTTKNLNLHPPNQTATRGRQRCFHTHNNQAEVDQISNDDQEQTENLVCVVPLFIPTLEPKHEM